MKKLKRILCLGAFALMFLSVAACAKENENSSETGDNSQTVYPSDGKDGLDGVGIERTEIDERGHLIVYYTDGRCEDVGPVRDNAVHGAPRTKLYGLKSLARAENGKNKTDFYLSLREACEDFSVSKKNLREKNGVYEIARLNLDDYDLTIEEAVEVWTVFYAENPAYYWLSNSATAPDGIFRLAAYKDYALYSVRQGCNQAIADMAYDCFREIKDAETELETALALYEYLKENMEYAYDGGGAPETSCWAHNLVGAASYNAGTCETYAKTYLYLCELADIDCSVVPGECNGEGHLWNLVFLDEKWYGVDVTLADSSPTGSYKYFGMSSELLSSFYIADSRYIFPEVCDSSINLVRLYEGKEESGLYPCLDEAFAEMKKSESEYTLGLFPYYEGEMYIVPDYYIGGPDLPEVKSITFSGDRVSTEKFFSVAGIWTDGDLTLHGDVIFENIRLVAGCIDAGEYRLITDGENCVINAEVKGTEKGGVITRTVEETLFCKAVSVDSFTADGRWIVFDEYLSVKNLYARGAIELFNGAEIENYYAEDSRVHDYNLGQLRLEEVTEDTVLTIVNARTLTKITTLYLSVNFYRADCYPRICLTGKIDLDVQLHAFGAHSIMTDMDGNIVAEREGYVTPFSVTVPLINFAQEFEKNLEIDFLFPDGVTFDRLENYCKREQNGDIVWDVTVSDEGYIVKDDVLMGYVGNAKTLVLPDGIVEIGIYALSCMPAEQVVLPASLVVIGEGAFAGCDKLKEIFIPAGVKQIGRNAFLKCVSLSSVAFEDSAAWTAVLSDDMYRKVTLDTSDRAENAENLTDVYLAYNWKKDN